MKVNNKKIKLKLLKLKSEKLKKKYIEQFFLHLKKILLIIFEFNRNNKKILFVGPSLILYKKFRKFFLKTEHSVIIKPSQIKKLLVHNQLKKNSPDLIIILNKNLNLKNFINEMFKLKVPLIELKHQKFSKIFPVNHLFFLFLTLILFKN